MTFLPHSSTCWSTHVGVLLQLGQKVEYKYAISGPDGIRYEGKSETEPFNVVPTGRRLIVEDDGGKHRWLEQQDRASPLPPSPNRPAGNVSPIYPLGGGARSASPSVDGKAQSNAPTLPSRGRSTMDLAVTEVSSEDEAFIVFRNLPITVKQNKSGEWEVQNLSYNSGTALPTLHAEHYNFKVQFVGQLGVYVKEESERKKIQELLKQHDCVPVFVDKEMSEQHISFCEDFLWPVFHNMKIFDTENFKAADSDHTTFNKAKWKNFMALNKVYAETIAASGRKDTLVWIHDYELVLVPRYLCRRDPDCMTGLFLHCSFPSSEVLRCLPNREEILQSMLSSRLVTFQTFDYMRHFMSCCSELLGARHSFQRGGLLTVEHESRSVVVTADHFAAPYQHLVEKMGDAKVKERAASIRSQFPGKTVISSYDRCDVFAGLQLKLQTFRRFLAEYQSQRTQVVLVQYIRNYKRSHDNTKLVHDLEALAAETNKTFGRPGEPPLVTLVFEDMEREKTLGVMLATDILLDSSINDGLNLTPFMFYTAHSADRKGVAIISEFSGCSTVLTGALKVNPWDANAVMTALDKALSMKPGSGEQAERFQKDHSYVSTQTLEQWVSKNLSELKATKSSQQAMIPVGPSITSQRQGALPLNIPEVAEAYRKAKSRALFLDYEGTIAARASWQRQGSMSMLNTKGTPPDPDVLDCLGKLASDRGNTVVVLSGRERERLDSWFGDVAGIGLCAEHGLYSKMPSTLSKYGIGGVGGPDRAGWHATVDTEDDNEWKAICTELISQYVRRVQGSVLESKGGGLAWNYREVGATGMVDDLALELVRFLDPSNSQGLLFGYPVKVVNGKGYVEVKRSDVDKGTAVAQMLEDLKRTCSQPVEFVLCIGDDRSDEDMFEAVANFMQEMSPATPTSSSVSPQSNTRIGQLKYFTATVGRKPTKAKYFVGDVREVSELLTKLVSEAMKSSFSRFSSMPTLMMQEEAVSDDDDEQGGEPIFRNKTGTSSRRLTRPV